MTEWRDRDLLGKIVTVRNPNAQIASHTYWTGMLIGYRDHPCVTLEFENGQHMCLPADWVERPKDASLADAAVRLSDLPKLFNVSDRTIRDWIAKDNLTTFEHPVQSGTGRPVIAIRWGDIPPKENHPTRWHRR